MNKLLSPGEISVGDWITVLNWKWDLQGNDSIDEGFGRTLTTVRVDNSWKGSPLKVVAVDLPFIAVKDASSEYDWNRPNAIKLDTRQVDLMSLNDEMVRTLAIKSALS